MDSTGNQERNSLGIGDRLDMGSGGVEAFRATPKCLHEMDG